MVVNPSTLLRLPGSIAWPTKPGRVTEPTEWVRPSRHQDSHTLQALQRGFPAVADEPGPISITAPSSTTELLNPVRALIDQVRAGPHWHEPALRLVALLVSRGRQDAEILAMAEHLTWPNYTAQQTREELAKMIEGARRKGFAPDEEQEGEADNVDDVMDVTPSPPVTFRLLSNIDLANLPDPEWLVEDWIVANTLCVVYGAWGSYKSFLVLHAALCLATGTPCFDLAVTKCDVLYIAGEGAGGLKQRVAAWEAS
jgi:AAA domain